MRPELIYFQFPQIANVRCAFQKRSITAGHNELAGNFSFAADDEPENVKNLRRSLFAELNQLGLKEWAECRQLHGTNLVMDPKPTELFAANESLPEADGQCTAKKGFGLVIKTADCQPVLLADKAGKHIMALHIGWRGNRANFAQKAIDAFCEQFALKPENLCAVRGPSLGPEKSRFSDFEREWGPGFKKWYNPDTQCMNLWKLTADQLNNAGLPEENIFGLDICTCGNAGDFFSYRANKKTGRQMAVIWISK